LRDPNLYDILETLLKSDKMAYLGSVAEVKFPPKLQYLRYEGFHGFILHDDARAIKEGDLYVLDRIDNGQLLARHRILNKIVRIPLSALGRGLRRISYVDTMDVTETSDYLILEWFDGIQDMAKMVVEKKRLGGLTKNMVDGWKKRFDSAKTHILLAQRFDMSASGTSLPSFYCDEPFVGTNQFWCIRGPEGDLAKCLTLWLNSTLNILQLLILRRETRGAWMQVDEYALNKAIVPDLSKLSKSEMDELLGIFEKVATINYPSIMDQLTEKHWARELVDEAWLRTLGYEGDAKGLLDELYRSLVDEIAGLRTIMAEGGISEE